MNNVRQRFLGQTKTKKVAQNEAMATWDQLGTLVYGAPLSYCC